MGSASSAAASARTTTANRCAGRASTSSSGAGKLPGRLCGRRRRRPVLQRRPTGRGRGCHARVESVPGRTVARRGRGDVPEAEAPPGLTAVDAVGATARRRRRRRRPAAARPSVAAAQSHAAIGRTAPSPSATSRCTAQAVRPCGASRVERGPGRGRASGASTNRRRSASGCGTTSRRSALPGSSDRPAGGRSSESRARPKTSRSRSSSRGPQRSPLPAPEGALERLQRHEQGPRPRSRDPARQGRRARRRHSGTPAGPRRRPGGWHTGGHPGKACAGERREGIDPCGERGRGIAEVRPEADVGSHPSHRNARTSLARLAR